MATTHQQLINYTDHDCFVAAGTCERTLPYVAVADRRCPATVAQAARVGAGSADVEGV